MRRRLAYILGPVLVLTVIAPAFAAPKVAQSDPFVGAWTPEPNAFFRETYGSWFIFWETEIAGTHPADGYGLQCGPNGVFGAYMPAFSYPADRQTDPDQQEYFYSVRCDEPLIGEGFDQEAEFGFTVRPDGNLDMNVGPNSPFTWVRVGSVPQNDDDDDLKGIDKVFDVYSARQWYLDLANEKLGLIPGTWESSDGGNTRTVVITKMPNNTVEIVYTTSSCPAPGDGFTATGGSIGVRGVTPTVSATGDFVCNGAVIAPDLSMSFYYHLLGNTLSPFFGGPEMTKT